MRPRLQEIKQKLQGTDVFIIGGGNSLKDFDFARLKNKNVIAINSAYKFIDDAILFWTDGSWVAANDLTLQNHSSKYRMMAITNADIAIKKNLTGTANSIYLKRSGDFGYDPNPDNVMGNNSGTMAINFAINMGAKRIILLGFDLKQINRKSHFHNDYDSIVMESVYDNLFIPSFKKLFEESKMVNTKIINCSPDSALNCFEFGDIDEFLT